MKILLTGSNGFLGKYILHSLSQDYDVDTLSRSDSKFKMDLAKEIPSFDFRYDIVIHCAGRAHYDSYDKTKMSELYHENIAITKNLILGLSKVGNPLKFVFISSVAVYGKFNSTNVSECENLDANDFYGLSKIDSELLISTYCLNNNIICTIFRLPLVVGHNPPGNLGAMINSIRKGYYFNIAGGNAKKSMVLASDVAKCLLKASNLGGIYNLTDGYHPSFAEISKHIYLKLGNGKPKNMPMWLAKILAKLGDLFCNLSLINSNKLKKITSDLTFDDRKAKESFGWNPTPVLEGFQINGE
jgi:nucleoside-diphosphate-sugar epimerase